MTLSPLLPMSIDSLLQPYQRFGVHLGLERIEKVLADLGNPHKKVPIIHVTGTNGKGSVCAYLSAILTEAGYKVGRYTSPHLIDWTERICINTHPIETTCLEDLLKEIQQHINPDLESPTQFEVITAAAWLYFARHQVDIAVIEVGLGGRLDATNVCSNPLVSIITSISREHWQVLGSTVAEIATEKVGILKENCPAVIGVLPPEAREVVEKRTHQLNCPTVWVEPAIPYFNENVKGKWAEYQGIRYPLPLEGNIQLMNSGIAIAAVKILQQKGWQITNQAIALGMAKTTWPGRLQWTKWNDSPILIDGAHNPAAAVALREYVDSLNKPVTWVMGMLSTKDHKEIFTALLRPSDKLYLLPVKDHSSADPEALANLALKICPQLSQCQAFPDLFTALTQATAMPERLVVLCGSLYLLGYFLSNNS